MGVSEAVSSIGSEVLVCAFEIENSVPGSKAWASCKPTMQSIATASETIPITTAGFGLRLLGAENGILSRRFIAPLSIK